MCATRVENVNAATSRAKPVQHGGMDHEDRIEAHRERILLAQHGNPAQPKGSLARFRTPGV